MRIRTGDPASTQSPNITLGDDFSHLPIQADKIFGQVNLSGGAVSGFAQDDWVRWGSAEEARGSNFGGHEFTLMYTVGPGHNLVARLYSAKALEKEYADAVALEDGLRFRIDWNISF